MTIDPAQAQAAAFVADLRRRMLRAADPAKAPQMQAYMKTDQPFYGIQAGPRRRLFGQALKEHPLTTRQAWEMAIRQLWAADRREAMYQALELAERFPIYLDETSWPLLTDLVQTATHWDTLDWIAAKLVGPVVRANRGLERDLIAWRSTPSLWVRRASLLAHLHHGHDTNLPLLETTILALAGDPDFFIRKAIGWVLRELARTKPDWVRQFVAQHAGQLSPLSRREALKHLTA